MQAELMLEETPRQTELRTAARAWRDYAETAKPEGLKRVCLSAASAPVSRRAFHCRHGISVVGKGGMQRPPARTMDPTVRRRRGQRRMLSGGVAHYLIPSTAAT